MTQSDEMQRLEAVLSIYGADRARWPVAERSALEALISRDARAAARLAQEVSFDQVLFAVPETVAGDEVISAKARLFARLDAEMAASDTATGAMTADRPSTVVPFAPRKPKPSDAVPPRSFWREASVMAAALLLGFFTVSQGALDGTGLDRLPLSASVGDVDEVSEIALGASADEISEEDLL